MEVEVDGEGKGGRSRWIWIRKAKVADRGRCGWRRARVENAELEGDAGGWR